MSEYGFKVGQQYTKRDIYQLCNVPVERQGGNWGTGYTSFDGNWFIFCNVGIPGRTGHDYANRFVGDDLVWYGKTGTHVGQASIQTLLDPTGKIFVFYRDDDRAPFTFAGKAKAISSKNQTPVEITWSFEASAEERPEVLAEEVPGGGLFKEGAVKTITVNAYERNPHARTACIKEHGLACAVCSFDFAEEYGDLGEGFIHVHHLKQLSDIGGEYDLDPVADLRPVCPNCHAMLHRRKPPYSIEELAEVRKQVAGNKCLMESPAVKPE